MSNYSNCSDINAKVFGIFKQQAGINFCWCKIILFVYKMPSNRGCAQLMQFQSHFHTKLVHYQVNLNYGSRQNNKTCSSNVIEMFTMSGLEKQLYRTRKQWILRVNKQTKNPKFTSRHKTYTQSFAWTYTMYTSHSLSESQPINNSLQRFHINQTLPNRATNETSKQY